MTQNFKGDALELKMIGSASPVFDLTGAALDGFYADGYDCNDFLLMLYDESRMPFSERVNRETFVSFIKEALINFPFAGSFESYLLVLRGVFGPLSEIMFEVPDPGKLSISVNAVSSLEFEFVAREFIGGAYVLYNITDYDGNDLVLRGIAGIDTEYELDLLFSEIMPIGIVPNIALTFYTYSSFVAEEPGPLFYDIVDGSFNNIIFREIG